MKSWRWNAGHRWSFLLVAVVWMSQPLMFHPLAFGQESGGSRTDSLFAQFQNPPRHHTQMPFWFWNDYLEPEQLIAQIADMQEKGVNASTRRSAT